MSLGEGAIDNKTRITFVIKLEGDSSEKVRRMCDFYPGSASRHTVMLGLQLGQMYNICLKFCFKMYGHAMDSNLCEPGKDINICLKFSLKMSVMLHIPEALRRMVMPWTPAWVNQEKISTFV